MSRTQRAKIPGLTPFHLLPWRGFSYAVVFSQERLIKDFFSEDTISAGFYKKVSRYLLKNYYYAKYSIVIRNMIGKYVLFASYNNGSFVLITKPRFRLRLLRYFLGGDKEYYSGILVRKIGYLYLFFVEDYLFITPDIDILKTSCDIVNGKRKVSLYDNTGYIENYDFSFIINVKKPLIEAKPIFIGMNKDKIIIRAKPVSSVFFDAIKKGKMVDSLPVSNVLLGMKVPYLELYDAYVSHYSNDELELSSCLWDVGGSGILWINNYFNYLFSLQVRVPEERLVSDIFMYLKLREKADRVVKDSLTNLYIFSKNNIPIYFLEYSPDVSKERFIFTNSSVMLEAYKNSKYEKYDGFINLTFTPQRFFPVPPYMNEIINWYFERDSLKNTRWILDFKEYKTEIYIEGRRNSINN